MIFRGPESLQYPSRKEFQQLGEIMDRIRQVTSRTELPQLGSFVSKLVPHEFSAAGSMNLSTCEVQLGHSNFLQEYGYLYLSRFLPTDPSFRLLHSTEIGTVTSEDSPSLVVPKSVLSLKGDFGIKDCLSVGIRGAFNKCTYFAFSNFDSKQIWKLRTIMQILGPHFHLAFARATADMTGQDQAGDSRPTLTTREEEIMRWVAEGKTNWEISIILSVSLNTIKFHLKNVYQKFGGVENRWAAVAQWQCRTIGQPEQDFPSQKRHQASESLFK